MMTLCCFIRIFINSRPIVAIPVSLSTVLYLYHFYYLIAVTLPGVGPPRQMVQAAAPVAGAQVLRRQDSALLLLAWLLHQDAVCAGYRRDTLLPLRSLLHGFG